MTTYFSRHGGMGSISLILGFVALVLFAMLGTIGLYEIGEDFIIDRTANATIQAANQSNVSSFYINKIQEKQQEFSDTSLPFDLILAAMLLAGVVGVWVNSALSDPMEKPRFIFMITVGLFIVAVVLHFLGQAIDWWLYDFFYVLFDGVRQDNSIVNWFFTYFEFNVMIIYIVSLMLNQIEVDLSKVTGQGRREA